MLILLIACTYICTYVGAQQHMYVIGTQFMQSPEEGGSQIICAGVTTLGGH